MGGRRSAARSGRLAAHEHLWAAAVLSLVVFGYLWPVLVGGRILSPLADLYGNAPWRFEAPSDWSRYINPTLFDVPLAHYPWRLLVRDLLREGTLPLWNPYVFSGIPLFSNPQTGLFSLFNLPLWMLPLTYALGVSAALKLLAGGFGTYLLARQLRLGFLPALLAGIAFAFCSFNIVWLAHDTLPGVVVMAPWALWLVERSFERRRLSSAIGLAIVTAIGLGGGHPGTQVHLLVVTAVYAVLRSACSHEATSAPSERAPPVPRAWRELGALALVAGGLALGTLLMAFMLIPEARGSHDTVGLLARQAGTLPPERLSRAAVKTALFPDWWGRPSAHEAAGSFEALSGLYTERTFYAGVVAFLLAAVGLISPGRRRRQLPFAVLGALGLAVALHAPGVSWLVTHLPIVRSVQPQRLHFAFELAIAVLAAFGLQAVIDAPAGARRRMLVPIVAALLGAFAAATAGARPGDAGRTLEHFLTGKDYVTPAGDGLPGVLALTSIGWFLLLTAGVGIALAAAALRPRWRLAVASGLVVLAVVDAFHFAHGFQPMGPASTVMPPVTPAIAYLERHRSAGRIAGLNRAFPNDWPLVYGLEDVRGYDTPQPTRRMLALWRVATPDQLSWGTYEIERLGPRQLRMLDLLGARYVVTDPGVRPSASSRHMLTTVYKGPDGVVALNAHAVRRALVPRRVAVAAGDAAARVLLFEPRFDPRGSAVLDHDAAGAAALARASRRGATRGVVAITRTRNASVTMRARLDRPGLVVLNDALMEGWTVRVDGHARPPLRVNTVMRGVIVPGGRHEIVWSYAVPGLRLGAAVSLLTLATLLAATLFARRREAARRR